VTQARETFGLMGCSVVFLSPSQQCDSVLFK